MEEMEFKLPIKIGDVVNGKTIKKIDNEFMYSFNKWNLETREVCGKCWVVSVEFEENLLNKFGLISCVTGEETKELCIDHPNKGIRNKIKNSIRMLIFRQARFKSVTRTDFVIRGEDRVGDFVIRLKHFEGISMWDDFSFYLKE